MRRLLLSLFLIASPAWAADDVASWVVGESTQSGGKARIAQVTSTFTNITEGAVPSSANSGERSIGFGATANVRLVKVEVRSTNCAACTIVIQTATGANGGAILWAAAAGDLVAYTPEASGAAYTDYINELVGSDGVPTAVSGERRMYIRVYNGDSEGGGGAADEDVVVITTWES